MPGFVLASASPRRRHLLRQCGFVFDLAEPGIDETVLPGEAALPHVERMAREKAAAVSDRDATRLVLAADTVVVQDGRILGKPLDAEEAAETLRRLQGRTHHVMTAFALRSNGEECCQVVSTAVCFRALSDDEILRYVAGGEGLDKAGGYAIQGGAAGFVRSIQGSYTNVVGLPLAEVVEALAAFGIRPGSSPAV